MGGTEGIDFDLKQKGILHIYRDRTGFEHAGKVCSCWPKGWSAAPSRRRDAPSSRPCPAFYGGYFTESDSTGDIHKFTSGLAAACERLGVQCRYGQEIVSVTATANRPA
jgi:D-amino-acid dehydrogenase